MGNGGLWLLLIVYKIVLEYLYLHNVLPFGWGVAYTANESNGEYWLAWGICAAYLLIVCPLLAKPLSQYRCSEFILLTLLLMSVWPGMVMCGLGAFPFEYTRLFYGYWLLFFFIVRGFFFTKAKILSMAGRLSHSAKESLLIGLGSMVMLSVLFVFVYYNGGNFFVAGIQSSEVYQVRLHFRSISMPVLLNYIMANASIVLLLLMMFFLNNKRYILTAIVCLVQYMNYSCGANKIVLLSMLVVMLVYALGNYISVKKIIGIGILVLVAAMIGMDLLHNFFLMSFIVRMFFLPAFLNYCYYDYFQMHPPVLDSLLGDSIIDNMPITFIIGQKYLGNALTNANNGLLGDAVRIFGEWGVILHPVFWCMYLYFLDWASRGIDWRMKFGVSIYWAVVMQDSFITTSMFSHGGVALMGMVYLINRRGKSVTVKT